MVIDDLADRPHLSDLQLDPGCRRTVADYKGLVPGHAKIMAGPSYALLRPEFTRIRTRRAPSVRRRRRVFVVLRASATWAR